MSSFVSNPKCTVAWPSSYNYVAITSIKIEGMTFIVYDKHGYNQNDDTINYNPKTL